MIELRRFVARTPSARPNRRSGIGIGGLLCLTALLALPGCSRPTPIKELAANSAQYKTKEVTIRGRVVSTMSALPFMQKPLYVVSDGTGQIAVLSSSGTPVTNHEVTVKGQLQDVPAIALPIVGRMKIAEVMIEEKERQESETK